MRLRRWDTTQKGENFNEIRQELQKVMQTDFGVFRQEEFMQEGLGKLKDLQERLKHAL